MEIYLISLQKDSERKRALKKTFPNHYDKFEIIDAIDGRMLSAKLYFNQIHQSYKKFNRLLSPTEVGCSLSHIKALETFLESQEDYALILEDDIMGTDQNIHDIKSLVPHITETSILMCGGQDQRSLRNYLYGKNIIKNLFLLAPFSHFYVVRACCYVVTRSSAAAILATQREHLLLADSWNDLIKDKNIDIYFADILTHPEDNGQSNIEGERYFLTADRRTFRQKWLSIGTLKSLANRFKLYLSILFALMRGYKKV